MLRPSGRPNRPTKLPVRYRDGAQLPRRRRPALYHDEFPAQPLPIISPHLSSPSAQSPNPTLDDQEIETSSPDVFQTMPDILVFIAFIQAVNHRIHLTDYTQYRIRLVAQIRSLQNPSWHHNRCLQVLILQWWTSVALRLIHRHPLRICRFFALCRGFTLLPTPNRMRNLIALSTTLF